MKTQLLVSLESKMIYGVASDKGKTHDFKMFKDSKARVPSEIGILADSGYQGIKDIHANSRTPIKKPKGKKLTKRQKLYNHLLSKKRIVVENIIRRCKIFRITKDVYRGKHKNHGKVWNLVAGLVNLRYVESVI
jgi:IS5 family transposase|tara:strand:+ start:532 stop:933 length:402 start_codon:yes stop_codon:yes gene_type:complete